MILRVFFNLCNDLLKVFYQPIYQIFLNFPTNTFIPSNTFIRCSKNYPPTCLFHPTRLLGTLEYVYSTLEPNSQSFRRQVRLLLSWRILDFKTTWSEFQKPSQTTTERGKAKLPILNFKTTWFPKARSDCCHARRS